MPLLPVLDTSWNLLQFIQALLSGCSVCTFWGGSVLVGKKDILLIAEMKVCMVPVLKHGSRSLLLMQT